MKKLIILFTFLLTFLFIPNVSALTLGSPSVYYYQNDVAYSSSVSTDNWSSTPVYVGTYIGDFGSNFPHITRVDYNWFNLNLCSGKNVSISGSVHAIFGFFLNQSYTLSFYMNNEQLVCSTQVFDNGNALHYDCYGDVGGGTFSIYLIENSFTTNLNYNTGVSQDVSYSCDVSNEAIVNQSITNTQNIINNQNSNTNTITQNQDTNTQNIINNQNSNTQDIINNQNSNTQDTINSQLVCNDKNSYSYIENKALSSSGTLVDNSNTKTTDFIKIPYSITPIDSLYSSSTSRRICFYSSDTTSSFISCLDNYSLTLNTPITIPDNSKFFRFTLNKTVGNANYNICYNGNQILNDTLTDTSSPDTTQDIEDMENMVASDTPISDLITMPLTLFNAYINGINSSCSSFNLGNLYGTNLVFPCLDLEQRLGSNLWSIIDALFSIFMCYNIGMLFITAFDGLTSLRDDFEGLYQPRHADTGYQPKHGG